MRNYGIFICIIVVAFIGLEVTSMMYYKEKKERERWQHNYDVLQEDNQQFQVRESLNAVSTKALQLTNEELKKNYADASKLINDLKGKKRTATSYTATSTITTDTLYCVVRDTVLRRDTVEVKAPSINIDTKWYSLHGYILNNQFRGTYTAIDSIRIIGTIRYKRFLGFLWKTGVKDTDIRAVSLNPHTHIGLVSIDIK